MLVDDRPVAELVTVGAFRRDLSGGYEDERLEMVIVYGPFMDGRTGVCGERGRREPAGVPRP